MTAHWTTLDAELGLYCADYAFSKTTIKTLVVRLSDGKLLVAGPGIAVSAEAFAELDSLGEVAAIVTPGPYHHLGFPEWKARYPGARLFAGAEGCKRIPGQHKGVELGLEELSALQPLLPDHVSVDEVSCMKKPDLHLVVRDGSGGSTWFSNEVLTNEPAWPSALPLKLVFQLSGSHPGLNINGFTRMFFGGAKKPIRAFYDAELDKTNPTRLVPSHGAVLEAADLTEQLRAVFAKRL